MEKRMLHGIFFFHLLCKQANTLQLLKQKEQNLSHKDLDKLQAVFSAFTVKCLSHNNLQQVKKGLQVNNFCEMIWNGGKEA